MPRNATAHDYPLVQCSLELAHAARQAVRNAAAAKYPLEPLPIRAPLWRSWSLNRPGFAGGQ